MAARRRGAGKSGGLIGRAFTLLFVAAFVVAFIRVPTHQTAGGVWDFFDSRMQTVSSWVEGLNENKWGLGDLFNGNAVGDGHGRGKSPGSGGSDGDKDSKDKGSDTGKDDQSSGSESPKSAVKALDKIKKEEAQNVAYKRDEWKHWSNVRSCWNTREEVLYRDAVPGTQELTDKDGNKVTSKDKACNIVGGKWVDPYSGKTFTKPGDLDIDHMIPLKYAATHGGQNWNATKKEEYANSLAPGHLLAVSASQNRSKGDKGPASWKPADKGNHCVYAQQWVSVASTWKLSLNPADHAELGKMLAKC